jgi:hypothetical protein
MGHVLARLFQKAWDNRMGACGAPASYPVKPGKPGRKAKAFSVFILFL